MERIDPHHLSGARPLAAQPWAAALKGAAVVAVAVAALWIGWVGFIASDDALYYAGATPWLTDPPFAGNTHWATRFPLTIPFAATLAVMGQGFAAFATLSVACYGVLVAMSGWYARRVGGARAGWIAALIVATLPVVVSHATTVSVDLLEAAALLAGALLLADADDTRAGLARAMVAGCCFGVAILCRETSLLALAGLGPLFLLGRPVPRRVLIAAGLGTLLVLGGEALFQAAMTGDPLRRYTIAFHHDEHIDRAANMEGNFLIHPVVDPLLVLLINDDFGLLFWLAGATLLKRRHVALSAPAERRLAVPAAMALASFVLVSILYTKLVLNPRYFMLAALVASIWLATWLARLGWWWRAAVLSGVIATNLLLLSVANAHPRWAMEALVMAARAHPREPVAADRAIVARAALPIRFGALRNITDRARPGGLMLASADVAPAGTIVAYYPSPPTRLGALLRATGQEARVPGAIRPRMFAPSEAMVLVRTPG